MRLDEVHFGIPSLELWLGRAESDARCKALQSVAKCAKQPAHSACTGLLVRAENLLCWTNCVVTAITYGTMDAVATNNRK